MTRITADAGLSVEELFAKYPAKSAHDATLMGCERFFTGRPCKSGHVAPRATVVPQVQLAEAQQTSRSLDA
jgi:hypothetical protein